MEYVTTDSCTLLQECISDYANVKFHTCKSLVHVNYFNKQPSYKISMLYAIPLHKRYTVPSLSALKHTTQSVSFIQSVTQQCARLKHDENKYTFYNIKCICVSSPRRCPYFDVAVGLVWSNDPESYAGGNIATGSVIQAGQVKSDDPDKKGHPGPPGWGLGVGVTTPPCKRTFVEKTSEMLRMYSINRRRLGPGNKRMEEKS
jgi:hypothetical protein